MAFDSHRRGLPNRLCFGSLWLCVAALVFSPAPGAGTAQAQPPARGKSAAPPQADPNGTAPSAAGLPPGYQAPRDPPASMLEEKNLLTPEEREQFKKELSAKYSKPTRNGEIRGAEVQAGIRNGIRYRLNELTIAKNRRDLPKIRERLTIQDLRQAGSTAGMKVEALREFRRQLLQMVVDETEHLFDNNYYVRLQAALLLGELNLMEEDPAKGFVREAFPPAAKPLCRVILDPEQPEAVKIVSVLSLIRIVRQGNPNVEQKRDIATAVVSELKRTETHYWYQSRLAEVLGSIDVPLDLNREPFVFNVLNSVLKDRNQRDLRVRVQAAWSLGRHPLVPQVDLPQLAADLAAVGLDLAQEHAKNPGQAHWKRSAVTLYFAFKAKNKTDMEATRQREGGLLNNPQAAAPAKEAYDQLLPVITSLINGDRVAPELIQSLGKWVDDKKGTPASSENKPLNLNVGGNGP